MIETKNIESLQRLKCKLGNALEHILIDKRSEIRSELLLFYAIIHNAIIASVKMNSCSQLGGKWKHVQRRKRKDIVEDRAEAREWLMSDMPKTFWNTITDEDWEPVKDQIHKLWMDMNSIIMINGPVNNFNNKLSNAIRTDLYKVSMR